MRAGWLSAGAGNAGGARLCQKNPAAQSRLLMPTVFFSRFFFFYTSPFCSNDPLLFLLFLGVLIVWICFKRFYVLTIVLCCSATKDTLSVGTVSKANGIAWVTILSSDLSLPLLLLSSRRLILLLRWSSLLKNLRLSPRYPILPLLLATCPPLLNLSRRHYSPNPLPRHRLNIVSSTTARPLTLRWRGATILEIWPACSIRPMSPMGVSRHPPMRLV